ncbi:S-formylglutathione hydrolase FrmB [Kitasatospora sp. MAP12-15]|uniref:alpha/beta hydrolase n=1 Tax=unclassified Kitasatospora TaxID=2633591 RepID=UPI002473312C|nr:alpha/beta hydrolase-fold protein [Kitasatospora sp. MAP12-44]MDH6114504.1 S-formylglutathione hydrolase FrmB [Kitasatospora sp. MAP12-44]
MSQSVAGGNPLDWSLTEGVIPVLIVLAGLGSLTALLLSRDPQWWTRRFPAAVLLTVGVSILLVFWIDYWWQPFSGPLPRKVWFWIGLGVLAVTLAAFRMPGLRWRGRGGALCAAVLVLVMSSNEVNRHFDQYPTLRVLFAPWLQKTTALPAGSVPGAVGAPPGQVLAEVWHAPPALPAKGTVSTSPIPGLISGFHPRGAYVYLPPAYQTTPRALLPVLVLMAGQPGSPLDWITTGNVPGAMDAFAAEHQGLAPVVVIVDPIGSDFSNTLCMNSRIAQAQTYLAEDVPNWIRTHLQVATGRGHWAIGGLSLGGTCSLQLAVNAPQVYGSFLDISGQDEPTLGSHRKTVDEAFGGDEAAFDAVDPLHVMARERFPDTAASFVVGAGDREYRPQQAKVYAAAVAAGMRARAATLPGGHDWTVFRPALAQNIPWLAQQTGLTR